MINRTVTLVTMGIVIGILVVFVPWFSLAVSGVLLLAIIHQVCNLYTVEPSERRYLSGIIAVVVVIRLVAIVVFPEVMELTTGVPHVAAKDPAYWEAIGWELSQQPLVSWQLERGKSYTLIVAGLYRAFGRFPALVRLVNLIVLVAFLIYSYRIARQVFNKTTALVTASFIAVSPSFIILTVRTGHDMISIALVTTAIFYLIEFKRKDANKAFVGFISSVLALYYLRHQLALFLPAIALTWYTIEFVDDQWNEFTDTPFRCFITLAFGFGGLVVAIVSAQTMGLIAGLDRSLDSWVTWKLTTLDSSGLVAIVMSMPTSLRLVFGTGVFVLLPFPQWEILANQSSLTVKLYSVEALILYLILPYIGYGIHQCILNNWRDTYPILSFTIGYTALVSVKFTGASVARYRAQVLAFGVMLAAYGLASRRGRRISLILYYASLGFGIGVYSLFKML